MSKLRPNEYATLLCDAIRAYDFPAVTVEFDPGGGEIVKKSCHGSMWIVEKHIGALLRSGSRHEVKDGLSSVLYWGWAQKPELGTAKVDNFRTSDDLAPALDAFIDLDKKPPLPSLLAFDEVGLPGFGMSFTTKIMMFLSPETHPVLDKKIALIARRCNFLPLLDILAPGNGYIPINQATAAAYEKWACWCRKIATLVNETRASPRHDLRAVDVERALFTLARDNENKDAACALLQGPEGWTFDGR